MNNNINLSASFNKLIANCFSKYKGVTIEKAPDGFIVFGRKYSTWEEAAGEVDRATDSIDKSTIK